MKYLILVVQIRKMYSSKSSDFEYFEEIEENGIKYYRRGRCLHFWVDDVGKNSTCGCCKISGNKGSELYRALKCFTGNKFSSEDWDVLNPSSIDINVNIEVDENESLERCFCTQTIKRLRYALYKPTNELILVGSECIAKFLGKEKQKIADGRGCMVCNNPIDRRKKYHRDGYCSLECEKKHLYKECKRCFDISVRKDEKRVEFCEKCIWRMNNYRICSKCNDYNIHLNTEDWKEVCGTNFGPT